MTDVQWRSGLSRAEQDAVRALIDAATRADGVAPVGESGLRGLADNGVAHLLAGDPAGPDGYLTLASDGSAELVVRPADRGHGVGTWLARAAIDRTGGGVRFWAHGTLPLARATAAALNLQTVRELLRMSRTLRGVDDMNGVVPQGVRVRSYSGSADDAELLRVNNAAFAWHPEQGGWTGADLAARLAEPWFDPAGLLLAVDEQTGALRAFHWTKVHNPDLGEVYVLGVDPAAQGRGLGRAMTLAGLAHLARRLAGGGPSAGDPEVMLYVESDNAAAINTYTGLGFAVAAVDTCFGVR